MRLAGAVARLTGAKAAMLWGLHGEALSSAGWEASADAVAAARGALGDRSGAELIAAGDDALGGLDRSAPGGCDRFLHVPLEGGRFQMLLGFARDAEPALDLKALSVLTAAAIGPRLEPSFDSAQLVTIREIVSGIAHDAGTPLNVISGYSEYLLMSGGEEVRGRKEISTILDQTRRLAQMIHHMLDSVRVAAGDSGRARALAAFADESLQIAAYMLRKAQVKCRIDGEVSDQATVSGDLPLLYQAVFHVLGGAARAAGASGQLVVRPVAGPETGAGLEIEAADAAGRPVDLAPLAAAESSPHPVDRLGALLVERALGGQGGGLVPVRDQEGAAARLLLRINASSASRQRAGESEPPRAQRAQRMK